MYLENIQRRIMAGWAAYAKHRDIFKSNLAICLKRQVYNSCVLPAMTYGAETRTLTKQAQNKLAAAQTKMERSMLNITYKDRRTNIWVRERKKLIDVSGTAEAGTETNDWLCFLTSFNFVAKRQPYKHTTPVYSCYFNEDYIPYFTHNIALLY